MNRKKLSQLIIDMRAKRGENQREFAKYFSQLGGKKVSYGFIQTLEDTEKTSLPEWGNMKTIAKMWNVSVGELDFYLENDD